MKLQLFAFIQAFNQATSHVITLSVSHVIKLSVSRAENGCTVMIAPSAFVLTLTLTPIEQKTNAR
jgi:hypothetical protein